MTALTQPGRITLNRPNKTYIGCPIKKYIGSTTKQQAHDNPKSSILLTLLLANHQLYKTSFKDFINYKTSHHKADGAKKNTFREHELIWAFSHL